MRGISRLRQLSAFLDFHPRVTADLVALLSTGACAAKRSGLQAQMRDGVRYWEFKEAVQHGDAASSVAD